MEMRALKDYQLTLHLEIGNLIKDEVKNQISSYLIGIKPLNQHK